MSIEKGEQINEVPFSETDTGSLVDKIAEAIYHTLIQLCPEAYSYFMERIQFYYENG